MDLVITPDLWAFYCRDFSNYPLTMRFLLRRMAIHPFHGGGTISQARPTNCAKPDYRCLVAPCAEGRARADGSADGYGPFDDYDIGSKQQKGSIPTRFGTREQLQRCVAVMRANGLDVYLDLVEHQRIGDTQPFIFRYPGADSTPNLGRFPKDPPNFVPQVPRDPNLGGAVADDVTFGRELAPINGQPPHYVFDNLFAAADWLTRTLGVQGYRIDDVKGISTDFLFPFLNSQSMAGKFAVGEFFDGDQSLINNWVFDPVGMRGRVSAFDFPLRFTLAAMCGNPNNAIIVRTRIVTG